MLDARVLRVRPGRCPGCGGTLFTKFGHVEIAVRCIRCHASGIHMSIMAVLNDLFPNMRRMSVYEMSSRGPLVEFLADRVGHLTLSEYFDDVAPGQWRGEVQCQDVQRLTYPDAEFDLCTSTDVFEHVEDDLAGFREVRRVLRRGGTFVFTVPIAALPRTVVRAVRRNGRIEHLLPPEYHLDTIRGENTVLCFRDYGHDLPSRLISAGFADAQIRSVDSAGWWSLGRPVIVARAG